MKKLLATLLLLCHYGIATHSHAQASFFDPTFGVGGKVIVNEEGRFNAVAVQPDGKIVVAGPTEFGALVARYKENGTPDSSFGVNGRYYYTAIWGTNLTDLVLQPDGKIVAIGSVTVPGVDIQFFTLRLNTDGTPDHSFGSGGVVITNLGSGNDYGYSVALQADGKIVLGGLASSLKCGLARLHANGVMDSSFGTNGVVIGPNGDNQTIDVTPDGKIIIAATASSAQDYALMTIRYLTNGTPDTSYNHTGIVLTIAGALRSNVCRAVKVQPDGRILVAGRGDFGVEGSNFVAVRYDTNGTLDASFGTGGIVNVDFEGQHDASTCMYLTATGKIQLAGSTAPTGGKRNVAVAFFDADGVLDTDNGNEGKIMIPIRTSTDYCLGVAGQPDEKIIIIGNSYEASSSGNLYEPYVARLLKQALENNSVEINTKKQVVLFPNPANGRLFVSEQYRQGIVSISAFDAVGRKANTRFFDGRSVDVTGLGSGLYLFIINYDNGVSKTQRIMLMSN